MTGRELEKLTCGEAEIDVAQLKAHTSYGGDRRRRHGARTLLGGVEAFTTTAALFLKFIWGAQ